MAGIDGQTMFDGATFCLDDFHGSRIKYDGTHK